MNFGLSEEQSMLKKTVRKFMEDRCPTTFVREMMADAGGYSPKQWQEMAELGWMGLTIPEEYDGMGMGLVELAVMMEEMGRAVLPAPFVETLMAAEALLQAGSAEQKKEYLPRIASGELIATLAMDEPEGFWEAAAIKAKAVPEGDGYKVSGTKLFVPYANAAGLIVTAVRTAEGAAPEEGITLICLDPKAPGVTVTPLKTMDQAYRLCEVQMDGVAVPAARVLGEAGQGWPVLEKVIRKYIVALSAEMVGGAEKAMEMTVQYAKERVQFGKPIGSFQAIKHRCADMLVDIEGSRGSLYYAAWAVENDVPGADLAASAAKAYCSDTYFKVTAGSIQCFGGIGFTWEHDIHLFFKRAKRLETTCGDATFHRERIAELWL